MEAWIASELVFTDDDSRSITGIHLQTAIWSASSREGNSSPETSGTSSPSRTHSRTAPWSTTSLGQEDRLSRTPFDDGSVDVASEAA